MVSEELSGILFACQDAAYRKMQCRLLPNLAPETIIGVPTPVLRQLARQLACREDFLRRLPHSFFEENQIHAFCIETEKDFARAVEQVEAFLPFVDNWATCDQLRPKAFRRCHRQLLPYISKWLQSDRAYTVRFGMGMLMCHFLDADFEPAQLDMVAAVQSEEYYVKMMAAWYFATALAKQYNAAFPYIAQRRLEKWTHNKAIQKAVESRRISPEQKEILKKYRIKG